MYCPKCGNRVDPTGRFCQACGAPLQQPAPQPAYQQPAPQPAYQQPAQQLPYQPPVRQVPAYKELSWKEFYQTFVTSKWTVTTAVICFVTAALSLILLAVTGNMIGILDVAVYLSMGILLLITKHWAFSLASTVYGGIWSLVSMASDGTPSGVFATFAGIMCTVTLIKARKAYKAYKEEHVIPENL